MNGPSEFHVDRLASRTGRVVDRLPGVARPDAGRRRRVRRGDARGLGSPSSSAIPDVRSHVFAESSHMPHVEEPEAFTEVVGGFLREHD